jgi:excisionase family DNA binding protein
MTNDLLTLAQAAQLAGVNPASLRRAIARGTLAATKYGKTYLVTADEIARFIRERRFADRRREIPGMRMYVTESLPNHWVINDATGWWLVPNVPGGWTRRTAYRGHVASLAPVSVGVAAGMARLVGYEEPTP